MRITRIYSNANGDSVFDEMEIPLKDHGEIGRLSDHFMVKVVQFRKVSADYDYDFHCAPQKQFIVLLDGGVQIENSMGETRIFQTGEILLVEDTVGKGHRTKNLEQRERTSLFIHI
ncbi:hypothetical protein [Olivibacter sp. XZL3]|uniref:hypothetical protein n=1 Tax=Olivibacter sp. XZL3 TaxID=1735116 RepID=UPI001065112E|nr:hypothetical protein [Olivibacter sp. XZL3]